MTASVVRPRGAAVRSVRSVRLSVVGVLGEIMLTLGVLLGLFVVWQLWWTDVVADDQQAQIVEDLGWARVDPPSPDAPAAPDAPALTPRTDAAPVLAEPPTATTFATLRVPRWGPDYVRPISQGTDRRQVLDVLGLGHYEGTAMPGEVGNFAVAGHRTTYGKPLNRVEELVVGDPLVVQTEDTWYVYTVTETRIVRPDQTEVIAPVPGDPEAVPTERMMTLTTCHPMYSARQRYIVHAKLAYWLPTSEGTPPEIAGA